MLTVLGRHNISFHCLYKIISIIFYLGVLIIWREFLCWRLQELFLACPTFVYMHLGKLHVHTIHLQHFILLMTGLHELFNLTSACSGRRSLRSATKGDFLVPRARTATTQSALEFCPIHCANGRLGQDLGFGGIAFALKLPELLNRNLAAVRAKILFP